PSHVRSARRVPRCLLLFCLQLPAPPPIYPLSLHDALPISPLSQFSPPSLIYKMTSLLPTSGISAPTMSFTIGTLSLTTHPPYNLAGSGILSRIFFIPGIFLNLSFV